MLVDQHAISGRHGVCRVHFEDVPSSEATSPEATDYVMYYYGLSGYEQWKNQDTRHSNTGMTAS